MQHCQLAQNEIVSCKLFMHNRNNSRPSTEPWHFLPFPAHCLPYLPAFPYLACLVCLSVCLPDFLHRYSMCPANQPANDIMCVCMCVCACVQVYLRMCVRCSYHMIILFYTLQVSNPEETAVNFDMFFYSVVLLIKNDNNIYICG